jgi:hypothetical protein
LLALVAVLDLDFTALLNGELDDERSHLRQAPRRQNRAARPALYGLCHSPHQGLTHQLHTTGFEPLTSGHCVFMNRGGSVILTYVDDIVFITTTVPRMTAVKQPISHCLEICIRRHRDKRMIEASVERYIDKLVGDYD